MTAYPLVTILPFEVDDDTLPIVPESDLQRLYPYEAAAYEHWILGGSADSLIGRVNGRSLTPQSNGITYPSEDYLSMLGTQGKALLTDMEESITHTDTIVAVLRRTGGSPAACVPFGTLSPSADAPTTGCSPFFSTADVIWNRANGLNTGVSTGKTAPEDVWLFIAMARSITALGMTIRLLVGGQTLHQEAPAGTYRPAASPKKIALGSAYFNSNASAAQDVAEFLLFDQALSASALAALYARTKARCADRGITVV
ncbi:hypothetical protein [Brevundimonas sp. UBA7664]|uniref:hypothetical protein n=1 Tax=Brevundimonas sp. UBA7664 TaxID=1946141 RepID=UPI0025B88BAD|nr:hypothetical protein [Brevundimonas sp. UBA7664]